MSSQTDVVVLGVGTGGEELAGRLAMAGLDVVGIEPELVGGECAYWACLPTKSMIRSSNLLQEARRADGYVGRVDVTPDWDPVAERVREITGEWDDSFAVERFEERGGTFVRGRGALTGPKSVAVGDEEFTARRGIVIITGSKPTIPPISGLDGVEYWTSRDAVAATEPPESLIVVGGGTVGCEIGQLFSRFGTDVTIVDVGDRLLSREEPEASELLTSVFEDEGISVRTGAQVEEVRPAGASIRATLDDGGAIVAERLLVAVGRSPNTGGLGLENAGVGTSDGFIDVDDAMKAADGIWAMGDVTNKAMFTHLALHQVPVVEAGILGEPLPEPNDVPLAGATFTDPEIGWVGLREAEARDRGLDVAVTVKEVPATFRGFLHGPGNDGLIKLIADRDEGVLVGATSVGPRGGEVLGMLTTAIYTGMSIEDLRRMIYAFPTFHGGVGEAVGAYARALVQVLDPEAEFLLA